MSSSGRRIVIPLMQRRVQLLLLGLLALLLVIQILSVRSVSHSNDARSHREAAQPGRAVAIGVLIDLNRAEFRELALLPSVGPVLAKRIIADRTLHGPFNSLADLARVHGIGEKKIAQIAPYCETGPGPVDSLVALAEPASR